MKKTIIGLDVKDKKVAVRVDFNVPMKEGVITDDTRIKESLPTIMYLLDHGASVILISHLGRPNGVDKKYSLKPVADRLSDLVGRKVIMAKNVIGDDTLKKAQKLKAGDILLLENVRFEKGEEENDEILAKKLASMADIFVLDAFGTAHRKHASTYGMSKLLPNALGFLVEKEVNAIEKVLNSDKYPFVAVLGGAKVSDKIKLIASLLNRVDTLVIGGAMSYTFLKAKGYDLGNSKVEVDMVKEAEKLLNLAEEKGVKVYLPSDHVIADQLEDATSIYTTSDANILDEFAGFDIGKKTIKEYSKVIKRAKRVLWNGPMGVFEKEPFSHGTYAICKAMAKCKGMTVIGGGDSAAAITKSGYAKKIGHISTGGGASLKMFEGKVLPAVEVIEDKK